MENKRIGNGEIPSKNEQLKNALFSPKVKDAIEYDLAQVVSISIEKAIFYLGLKIIPTDRDMIKLTVIEDIKEHFKSLTIKEVELAIKNGSRGLYGEVFGVAPKDIYNWIYAYSQSQERREVVTVVEKEKEIISEPTEAELKALAWNNLLNAWAKYKEVGYYNDFGNIIYKQLVLNGKINYSEEQRSDFKRIAKSNLNREFNPGNSLNNSIKMMENKKILAQVNSDPENARLISEAKKVALNHFFSELLYLGSDIEDLF